MQRVIEDFQKSEEDYGKKGNNLKILADLFKDEKNIIIPRTLIISKSTFHEIIKENKNKDLSNYEDIYVNNKIKKEILEVIRKEFKNEKLVIRSSATCEDSIFFSSSGQYDSFLNVSTDEEIINAIKKIYASFFTENSKLYTSIYHIDLSKESMPILVQKVAPVILSGVMFSCNPTDGEKKYIVEWTEGLGTKVVEGQDNIKSLEVFPSAINKINNRNILELLKCLVKIKDKFGTDVDVEWGIDKENKIYIFQTRPVVLNNHNINISYSIKDSSILQKCDSISKGFAIGKISKIAQNKPGNILYKNIKYNLNNIKLILESKGIIIKGNNKLSHFANITRELCKPCVSIDKLDYDEQGVYIIDGFNKQIINFDALDTTDKIYFLMTYFEYLKKTREYSYEIFNGIINIYKDNKIEQVIFNIDENRILKLLEKNNYKETSIKEKIYTYDTGNQSLITKNAILRIQESNNKIKIQFKVLNKKESYREEQGIILEFDSLAKAKQFMEGIGMKNTGYQERIITKYIGEKSIVNLIKWPNCELYLGIEVKQIDDLSNVHKELELENTFKSGMGGKEIFERLNLTLEECKFKENEKCKRKKLLY